MDSKQSYLGKERVDDAHLHGSRTQRHVVLQTSPVIGCWALCRWI